MQKSKRISAFTTLGGNLESFVKSFHKPQKNESELKFEAVLHQAKANNGWFTLDNQLYALEAWGQILNQKNLEEWLKPYDIQDDIKPQKIGIVTAGNIPLVGFHDILCVLISGNIALVKPSSNDHVLIKYILNLLVEIEPEFQHQIKFIEQLKNYDAVIATGSDNTARYFESYFKDVPHIIRKNRTSVAVISGDESEEELTALSEDILRHFGLGCRNVTKLMVPIGYDLNQIFKVLYPWSEVINHHKYANNYDYHKAIYLMKGLDFVENGFVLVKQDDGLFSPISAIYYEEYEDLVEVDSFLSTYQNQIQCVVGRGEDKIPFGKAQKPELWDYADNVDTMQWIMTLKK